MFLNFSVILQWIFGEYMQISLTGHSEFEMVAWLRDHDGSIYCCYNLFPVID